MTMRVTVENGDSQRTAVVTEETFELGTVLAHKIGTVVAHKNTTVLGPGQERTFYIHAAKRLIVVEDPAAEIRAGEAKT